MGVRPSGNIIGPQATNINSVTAEKSGSGLASILLGAGSFTAGESGVKEALSEKYMAFYDQSDWRASSRLTANLGLRYEIQPGPTERYNRMTSFSFRGETNGTPGQLIFPGLNGLGRNLYKTYYADIGPRLGLAYRATDTMVVRSGFGVTFMPSNTGYLPEFFYGNQYFAPKLTDPTALQFGPTPAGALVAPHNQVNTMIPSLGTTPSAPQFFGSTSADYRFDYDNMKSGKVLQWNLFVEKRLHDAQLSVGYTGTHGYRLWTSRMVMNSDQMLPDSLLSQWRTAYINSNGSNPANLLSPNPYQTNPNSLIPYNGNLGTRNMTNHDLAVPYPFFPAGATGEPVGFSTYHALMAQFTKNLASGLTFNLHYTWSKSIDMQAADLENNNYKENGGLVTGSLDYRNNKNTYLISSSDIPHRVVATWSWAPPVGKGKKLSANSRFLNALLGDWNLGGVLIAQSGAPQLGFSGATGSINGLADRISGVPVEVSGRGVAAK